MRMKRIFCLNSITGKYSHGAAGVLPAALKAVKGAGGIECNEKYIFCA